MKNLVQNPVTDVQITGPVTVSNEVEVKNDSGNPIPTVEGLSIPKHDEIVLSYTGSNLTGVVYKLATATVATLALAYDGNDNLTSVTKS